MEQLFRLTELESRFPMNMNLLANGVVPRVISFKEALRQWLDHRREVLLRRARHRQAGIVHRLELVAGMLIVFLNLDAVIRIIREADDPKQELQTAFDFSDVQATYILDTRLRGLRRLEEMQLLRESDDLAKEKREIEGLLGDEAKQWKTVAAQIRELKKKYGPETTIGRRRTSFGQAPDIADADFAGAMIEREPVTVVVSEKGWIRALKGNVTDLAGVQFKGGDKLAVSFFAETTSKILVFASDGRIFTLEASKLPGGRGQGEPVRLMADIMESETIAAVFSYAPGRKMLVAANDGRGFVASQDDMVGGTRKGKQLLNVQKPASAALAVPAEGDHVGVIGENRKLLIFPLAQLPEMVRGKGVRLQRYRDGGLSDAKVFSLKEGLSWKDSAGRTFSVGPSDLRDWIGNRAEAGRLPPKGFPKNNRFD
jgi:topoisomerase IV subunit A